jgi:hypothetical protein
MRLGGGRDDGPFLFSCPGRKPHGRCEPGPILLCMGLFSRFCVWALRCTPKRRCAASGSRDRECFALTANRSNSNASCSSASPGYHAHDPGHRRGRKNGRGRAEGAGRAWCSRSACRLYAKLARRMGSHDWRRRRRVPYPVDTRLSLVDLNDVAKAAALVLTEAGHSAASYGLVGRRPRARSRSPRGNPHVLGWLLKRPPTRWRHLPHGWPLTHEAANRSGASAARSSSPTGPVAPQNVDRRSGFPPAIRRWSARPARCRRAGSSA